jgi:hypothetical protein
MESGFNLNRKSNKVEPNSTCVNSEPSASVRRQRASASELRNIVVKQALFPFALAPSQIKEEGGARPITPPSCCSTAPVGREVLA